MVDVNYLGHSCFKIKGKNVTLVIDPFSSTVGLKIPKDLSADIVLSSHDHEGHNNLEMISGSPVVIKGPGEYEVKGVNIFGYGAYHDKESGAKLGKNTIYKFTIDKINFLHLGDLGDLIKFDSVSEFNDIDVLILPVGNDQLLGLKEIQAIVSDIEPLIVLPMHYKTDKHAKKYSEMLTIDDFKKKSGVEFQSLSGKLSLAKEKLPDQTTYYVFE